MLISYVRGQGSIILRVKILNSSVATGAGLTGLTNASTGLIISTIADNESAATAYTVAGSLVETITTLGTYAAPTATKCRFKEVDATNHKGVYEIQIADARYAVASAKSLLVSISGATNAAETDAVIPLTDMNPYDAVRAGLTALPNAAASAVGGLPVAVDTSGRVDVLKINGTSQTARDIGASVLLSAGTGTGQLDFTSGVVKANLAQILGTAITETAGQIAAAFKKFFDVAAPVHTCTSVNQTGDSFARIGLAGTSLTSITPLDSSGIGTLLNRIPGTVQPQTGDSYARLGAPAGASHAVDVAAIKTDTGNLRTDYTTARAAKLDNLDATVSSRGTGDATAASQTSIAASIAALPSAATIADTTLARALPAESYAANGIVPTLGQMLYMLWSAIANCGVIGTTITTLKLDGATTSMTFTTDDGTSPTRRTRAT